MLVTLNVLSILSSDVKASLFSQCFDHRDSIRTKNNITNQLYTAETDKSKIMLNKNKKH